MKFNLYSNTNLWRFVYEPGNSFVYKYKCILALKYTNIQVQKKCIFSYLI